MCILQTSGDTVKLRGLPKAFSTKPRWKHRGGRGNDLGYGKNLKDDVTMGNPQPSPTYRYYYWLCVSVVEGEAYMDAVHRLNGGGL